MPSDQSRQTLVMKCTRACLFKAGLLAQVQGNFCVRFYCSKMRNPELIFALQVGFGDYQLCKISSGNAIK